ncbi:Tim44-like domain-containing protein [Schlegelella sp. S2-27]|uniref:Tim44-like domain-containing protein n=1 Tax=Caldimonas mangrovi TaxID=2944811 RepID=A0ABT0YHB3_9BURK|nr:Tim44-like domain-containing protein [Caldimonas mangrovi]MCM5678129.1 Tim44-like domain-containing protein [Caldimonas mangrovi]
MKTLFAGLLAVVMGLGLALGTPEVDAKRLGGGGMSRQLPPRQAPSTPPKQSTPDNNQASPSAAPGAAAAGAQAAGRRSWMGPIAGLAAGLGLAALMSHLGLGAEFANFLMLALLVLGGIFVVRWLMRSFSGAQRQPAGPRMQYAAAGQQPSGAFGASERQMPPLAGGGAPAAVTAPTLQVPTGFDVAAFERIAKMIFIRLQAANDAGDLDDLRRFTTPEMFATARLDLQDRQEAAQQTDVVQLDAQIVDFAQEDGRDIVSVRYHGLIREEQGGVAEPFDEVWHLVKPNDGSREWAIAGIQQYA